MRELRDDDFAPATDILGAMELAILNTGNFTNGAHFHLKLRRQPWGVIFSMETTHLPNGQATSRPFHIDHRRLWPAILSLAEAMPDREAEFDLCVPQEDCESLCQLETAR